MSQKGKPKRQDQKTIRAIIAKINRRLNDPALTKDEWVGLVQAATTLSRQLETPRMRKNGHSTVPMRPEQDLFQS